ncbi:hypothetical protein CJA_0382 [Cellvibrio japonicus Ueda107]|uniref:Uncharacterized protein n=1 Tax=Cellvibrio japonicus (strain Ueda107) TaxID=498211 RepID=B3PI43_CELJU|nr:hypothetical protein CJA_0382 [Cellvibrio japonicus Ueda107]
MVLADIVMVSAFFMACYSRRAVADTALKMAPGHFLWAIVSAWA